MSSWFRDMGWWRQEEAYQAFDSYRSNPTEENRNAAVVAALPLIRVVRSTQHFDLDTTSDLDDLVSAAAETICKALPKMADKNKEQIGNNKQFMRYLFTCVLNAFYRELTVIQHRPTKIKNRLIAEQDSVLQKQATGNLRKVELQVFINGLPKYLRTVAEGLIRFDGANYDVCSYIIKQLVEEREISSLLLQTMGCTDKEFFVDYSKYVLQRSYMLVREEVNRTLFSVEDTADEDDSIFEL